MTDDLDLPSNAASPETIAALENDFSTVHNALRKALQAHTGKLLTEYWAPVEDGAPEIAREIAEAALNASSVFRFAFDHVYLNDERINKQTRDLLYLIEELEEINEEPIGSHLDIDEFLKRVDALTVS